MWTIEKLAAKCCVQNMAQVVKEADIVVAAAGSPALIQSSWLKEGAVVIDVGTNSVDDPSRKSGYRLVGDADFESCKKVRVRCSGTVCLRVR
jgi:methylenetetrahydrofolate dehydrogenase (NADP+) / methenyltetrahydrofolate cyclohydrolase / formyltetrahydrofolate synthetase